MGKININSIGPNIFDHATSELSQDAMICWLLEWAKDEYAKSDKKLHDTGICFLNSILKKFGIENIKYQSIEIKKQYKKIDILCIINDQHALIIEDKTNTTDHHDQLNTYHEVVKKKYPEHQHHLLYFKTGTQLNLKSVKAAGYETYLRKDFLDVLKQGVKSGVKNNTYLDYYYYLENIEIEIAEYEKTPIDKWNKNSWLGFFQYSLHSKYNDCNLSAYGKSFGLYFHWQAHNQYRKGNKQHKVNVGSYLRISYLKAQIVIKLESTDKPKKILDNETKNAFRETIIAIAESKNLKTVKTNSGGKSSTIVRVEGDFRKKDGNSLLNEKATIKHLASIVEVLDLARKELKVK